MLCASHIGVRSSRDSQARLLAFSRIAVSADPAGTIAAGFRGLSYYLRVNSTFGSSLFLGLPSFASAGAGVSAVAGDVFFETPNEWPIDGLIDLAPGFLYPTLDATVTFDVDDTLPVAGAVSAEEAAADLTGSVEFDTNVTQFPVGGSVAASAAASLSLTGLITFPQSSGSGGGGLLIRRGR